MSDLTKQPEIGMLRGEYRFSTGESIIVYLLWKADRTFVPMSKIAAAIPPLRKGVVMTRGAAPLSTWIARIRKKQGRHFVESLRGSEGGIRLGREAWREVNEKILNARW